MSSPVPVPDAASELRGKRLLVVLGSYKSKRHIYERAKNLGVRLVVLDGPRHWTSEGADQGQLMERRLMVDLAPFESFVDRALTAVRKAGLSFDGIGTIDEFGGGFAARIAEGLGLPFHSTAATDRARNKFAAREACAAAGLAGPRFALIEAEDDLLQAARGVGFPAVLKPCSGVGSEQTYRIESEKDLARRYAHIVGRVRTSSHANQPGLSSDRNWFDLMWAHPPRLILESWIEGPKFDVDVLLDHGEVVYGHAIDDLDPCGLRDVELSRYAAASCSVDSV